MNTRIFTYLTNYLLDIRRELAYCRYWLLDYSHYSTKLWAGLAILLTILASSAGAYVSMDSATNYLQNEILSKSSQKISFEVSNWVNLQTKSNDPPINNPTHNLLDISQPIDFVLYRSDEIRSNDSFHSLFKRMGINDTKLISYLNSDGNLRKKFFSRSGQKITAELNSSQKVTKLIVRWIDKETNANQFRRLVIEKFGRTFSTNERPEIYTYRIENGFLQKSTRLSSVVIDTNLFSATEKSKLPDSIANQLSEIFASKLDFLKNLRKGDRFTLVYEVMLADNDPITFGRILQAEVVNNHRHLHAVWYEDQTTTGQYFDLNGESLNQQFVVSPLTYTRITSGFGMRNHPIAHVWKKHEGIDYAAPLGTPIKSISQGVVVFAGWDSGGYGQVIRIHHGSNLETIYAHLSKINVRKGQTVNVGEVIGNVGSTGYSTGPHLHFEVKYRGNQVDPSSLAKFIATPKSVTTSLKFRQTAELARQQFTVAGSNPTEISVQ
ncbi:MAG: M23 family metallopeptidase [Gammaproteobacteria bacterium]|nr:M23 family metallopeptidase [Gammaproteobacteria bacterium]